MYPDADNTIPRYRPEIRRKPRVFLPGPRAVESMDKVIALQEKMDIVESTYLPVARKIINEVSREFGVPVPYLMSRTRRQPAAWVRQFAMWRVREVLKYPYSVIARIFNRKDHTTVIHACEKMEQWQQQRAKSNLEARYSQTIEKTDTPSQET